LIFFKFFTSDKSIILAPRGELFDTELTKKFLRKKIYLLFFNFFLKKSVIFHATSVDEKKEIKKNFFKNEIKLFPNLVEKKRNINFKPKKISKPFRFVYFSRISPKKNLFETIDILSKVKSAIVLDIYGPIEDRVYWEKIRLKVNELKKKEKKLKVNYRGTINANKYKILNRYNFFILLSDSENFGHAIFESILSKCFPIVTKNSPWKKFEKLNCGLFLNVRDKFAQNKIDFFIKRVQKNSNKLNYKLDQIIKSIYQDQSKMKYEELFTRI
jgi:glycosyltransferase involved in cell wall biosynthesis